MNILHLCLDALDYHTLFSNKLNVAPNILNLSNQSLIISRFLANAGPTQFALPSVFTSSYPLDFGGYDRGIKFRPISLPKILHQYGYRNFFVGTNAWINKKEGYLEDFDDYVDATDPKLFWDNSKIYLDYNFSRFRKEEISLCELFHITYKRAKDDLERTKICLENHKKSRSSSGRFFIIRRYNDENLIHTFSEFLNIFSDKDYQPSLKDIYSLVDFDYILNRNKFFLTKLLNKIKRKYHCYYHTGRFLTEQAIDILRQEKNEKCYLYLHLYDIHERNFNNSNFQKINLNLNRRLKKIGSNTRINLIQKLTRRVDDDLRIAASVNYIDDQVGKLLKFLKQSGLINNTCLIISADHGLGGFSLTRKEQLTGSLYNEYLHVPFMIKTPKNTNSEIYSTLSSHLDILPTILDFLNIQIPDVVKGTSILKNSKSSRIIFLENATLGPCDLINGKPVQIGLIQDNLKLISLVDLVKEKIIWTKFFNLEIDWYEKQDISDSYNYQDVIHQMKKTIKSRIKEIKSQIYIKEIF